MELNRLYEMFRAPDVDGAVNKIVEIATQLGFSVTSIDFLRDFLFGYVETYLSGATCSNPECFAYLGHAKDIPNAMYCPECDQKIGPIKVTPLRMYLAIQNDADLFELIPGKIKADPANLKVVRRFGSAVLKFYDNVTLSMMMEPLLAWMKDTRPDLYYTVAFFPAGAKEERDGELIDYIDLLYLIEMDDLKAKDLDHIIDLLGLKPFKKNKKEENKKMIRDVISKGLDTALDKRSEYYVLAGREFVTRVETELEAQNWIMSHKDEYGELHYIKNIGASGYALKAFMKMIENLKNNMRDIIAEEVASKGAE